MYQKELDNISTKIKYLKDKARIIRKMRDGKTFIKRGKNILGTFVSLENIVKPHFDLEGVVKYTTKVKQQESIWRLPSSKEYERCLVGPKEKRGDPKDFTNCDIYNFGGRDRICFRTDNNMDLYFYHEQNSNSYRDNAHNRAALQDVGCVNMSNGRRPFRLVRAIERDTTNTYSWYNEDKLDTLEWFDMPLADKYKGYSLQETIDYIDNLNEKD